MIDVMLLHAVPGRCRFRVYGLRDEPGLLASIERQLQQLQRQADWLGGWRFNASCNSLVLEHSARDALQIEQWLAELPLEEVAPEDGAEADAAGRMQDNEREPRPFVGISSGQAFAWSCASLALSLATRGPFAVVPLLVSALPIYRRTFRTLTVERRLNVDFLDALALTLSLLRGDVITGVVMVLLVNLGDMIRDFTARRSKRKIRALLDFRDVQALLVEPAGTTRRVRASELEPGQEVRLLAGDVVPADGVVQRGIAAIDQRSITGESVPSTRGLGEHVYACSAVVDGSVDMLVTEAGDKTAAARIVQMLESAPVGETRIQNYAEKFADRLVAPLLATNVGLLAATGNVDRFLAMAIIDFGTGIRVAAPTSILCSMMRAAREGILIKSGRQVEQLASLRTAAFDKTGTLTRGELVIEQVSPLRRSLPVRRLLELAAAAEVQVRHPVARALVAHAIEVHGLTLPDCQAVDFTIGMGVSATIEGQRVRVGNERYFRQLGITQRRAAPLMREADRHGGSVLLVAIDETIAGVVVYADELRPESLGVIQDLKRRRIGEIVMLTGDRGGLARSVASALGIGRVFAEALPADKAEIIRTLRGTGSPIAMVGDGVNDSPALAQADVGIALVDGADIARDAADVVLMEADLSRMVTAIDISRAAMRLVRQNYTIVTACNAAALALSIPTGWVSPFAATLLSNGSAVAATLNAMRPLLGGGPQGRVGMQIDAAPHAST